MKYDECVAMLRWMLPILGLRWTGYRRVHGQVCKRFTRRLAELGLARAEDYRAYLAAHPEEWRVADSLCTVTISRFCRDERVFAYLADTVLPQLGTAALEAGRAGLLAWSAGCGSGEEPYTLALVWDFQVGERLPGVDLRILATDIDEALLRRAHASSYPRGCLRALPEHWLSAAFDETETGYRLRARHKERVSFRKHDIRDAAVNGPFDLILCRNLAFTYFDDELQLATARRLRGALARDGALVLGRREALPAEATGFSPWSADHRVYRKAGA